MKIGSHHTIELKKKWSIKKIGKHYSPKTEFKKGDNIGNQSAKGNKPNQTSFKKGQIGWNKNTIGLTKSNRTSFKKGMTPWNKGNKIEGGKTKEGNKIRHSAETRFWRRSCLIRDNFTDQKTGTSGGNLQVHHINNFADFPEFRFDINNGITFSKQTHWEFHHIYGKRNNTREQLEEFLNN